MPETKPNKSKKKAIRNKHSSSKRSIKRVNKSPRQKMSLRKSAIVLKTQSPKPLKRSVNSKRRTRRPPKRRRTMARRPS